MSTSPAHDGTWEALVDVLRRAHADAPAPKDPFDACLPALRQVWGELGAPAIGLDTEFPRALLAAGLTEAQAAAAMRATDMLVQPLLDQLVRERLVLFLRMAQAVFMASHHRLKAAVRG